MMSRCFDSLRIKARIACILIELTGKTGSASSSVRKTSLKLLEQHASNGCLATQNKNSRRFADSNATFFGSRVFSLREATFESPAS